MKRKWKWMPTRTPSRCGRRRGPTPALGALVLLLLPSPAAAGDAPPEAEPTYAVSFEQVESRLALVVDVGAHPPRLSVGRDGHEVVVRVEARPAEAPRLPAPEAPVEDLRLILSARRFEVRARVDVSLPFELRREGTRVSVVFGARPDEAAPGQGDFQALYRSLFPTATGLDGPGERSPESALSKGASGYEGLALGPLRLRPALLVGWVDGETTVGRTPVPVRDSYLQIEPRLGALVAAPLLNGGELRASYEPTLRTDPVLRSARRMAHQLDLNLEQPVGSALALRGSAHMVWDVLDTLEVDPGGEYFFALGRFRRDRYGAGLRFRGAGRLDLDLSGMFHRVRFREPAYFFDYDRRGFLAELGYELGPNLRAAAGYGFDQVPGTAGRIEAESRAHAGRLALYGELAPLLRGELAVGFERRTSPFAGAGGETFRGLTAHAQLTKEFSRAASLTLLGSRYSTLSAFETNAFYVANDGRVVLTLPLPLELSLRVGGGLQRNEYFVRAAALDRPRRDTLRGWTAGLGRPITRWGFLRADYRRDRRDSNLDEFDTTTWTFIVQLGIGWLGRTQNP
jgi:hypothetical protein